MTQPTVDNRPMNRAPTRKWIIGLKLAQYKSAAIMASFVAINTTLCLPHCFLESIASACWVYCS